MKEQTEELNMEGHTDKSKMEKLTEELKEMALTLGAFKVGIATTETLAGGPPSADLTYVLPGAKSAVVFALAFDQNLIEPYIGSYDPLISLVIDIQYQSYYFFRFHMTLLSRHIPELHIAEALLKMPYPIHCIQLYRAFLYVSHL